MQQRANLHPAQVDALVFLHANQDRKSKTVTEQDYDSEEVNKLYFSKDVFLPKVLICFLLHLNEGRCTLVTVAAE